MAALNFPNNPSNGDEHTQNNLTYRWDGEKWNAVYVVHSNITDNISEGSNNLYFTDARARAAVSATGLISYDSSTGVFSAASESFEDLMGATLSAGTGISVSYADNGANSGVVTISAAVAASHVASEREVQIGTNNTKIVSPLGLENSKPSNSGRQAWTGYTYETGTVDVAGEIKKDSDGNWNILNTSGHADLFEAIRIGTHIRIEHDSSNYEEGTIDWAEDDETRRKFRLETGYSSGGSFSDGDSISLTTEGEVQKIISDRTDIARTNVAETFDLALTVTSGGVTLTSGDMTVSSGDIALTTGDMTISSGDLTLSNGGLTLTSGAMELSQGDLTLTSGDLAISSGDLSVSENISVSGNVVISGDLTISGSSTRIQTEIIELADNIFLLNSNASGNPTQNAGIEIERGDSANKSFLWNETDDKWSLGSETLVAGKFEGDGSGITGIAASQVSGLPSDTDDLSEGSSNLYHTTARSRGAVSASSNAIVDYDSSTGIFTTDSSQLNSHVSGIIAVSGGLTKNVAADGVITLGGGSAVTASASAPSSPSAGDLWWKSDTAELFLRYNDGTDSAWIACAMPADAEVDLTNADTDDLSEGTSNLYHTSARARGAVSASSDAIVDYDSSTGVFTSDATAFATLVNSTISAGTGVDISKSNNVITLSADIDEVVTASSDAVVNVSASGLITTDTAEMGNQIASLVSAGTGLSESKNGNVTTLALSADTDDLTEGSTNQFFTDARAQAAITASSDAVVNISAGVISNDDAALATEVDAIISAGTGISKSKSGNVVTISNAQAITSSATAPSSPSAGDLWHNSETSELFIYYSDGTDSAWLGINSANANEGSLTRMAAVSVSGTACNFTGIPATARKIEIVFEEVSLSSGDDYLIRIGDAGGLEDSGYTGGSTRLGLSSSDSIVATDGFAIYSNSGDYKLTGSVLLHNIDGNTWVISGILYLGSTGGVVVTASVNGSKTLSGQLDRIQIRPEGGTQTMDNGKISVFYY